MSATLRRSLLLPLLVTSAVAAPPVPASLNPGDQYQLIFASSAARNALSADIAIYNLHVQNAADAAGIGGTFIWRAVASVATANANVNAFVGADIPVLNMNGALVAGGSSSFWSPTHSAPINFTEAGIQITGTAAANVGIWTGSSEFGVAIAGAGGSAVRGLGAPQPVRGSLNQTTGGLWARGQTATAASSLRLYGLSEILTVPSNCDTGFQAAYYNNLERLGVPALTRLDARIDFDWQHNSPGPGVNPNNFSVRWTGRVRPLYSETYTFRAEVDNGARLVVNGQTVNDHLQNSYPASYSGTIALLAGQMYDLVFEHQEYGGLAKARLFWSSPSHREELVPPACGDCIGDSRGQDFWLTFPENAPTDAAHPQETTLCIAGVPGTTGGIVFPPGTPPVPFTLGATGEAQVQLNPLLLKPSPAALAGSDVIENKGIHVMADAPVTVHGLNHIQASTDGYLALPTSLLGTDYLVMTYPNVWTGEPALNGSQFAIVAAHDQTRVQITPRVATGSRPANVPYYVMLQQGQTYQLTNLSDSPADLTGTSIRSEKPVAVFGSHRCASVPDDSVFFCNYLVEQLLPVALWGEQHFAGPIRTRTGYVLRVLAAYDSTTVTVTGQAPFILNRGQVQELTVNVTSPLEIRSSAGKPVLVAQYAQSSDVDGNVDADPFMTLLPAVTSFATTYRFCSPPTASPWFDLNYLNLVLPSGGQSSTYLDGLALTAISGPPLTFTPIGSTGYVFTSVPVSAGAPHSLVGASAFGLVAYGFSSSGPAFDGHFDAYAWPARFFYAHRPPQVVAPLEQTYYQSDPPVGEFTVPNLTGSVTVSYS
jgi:hypothetical protein